MSSLSWPAVHPVTPEIANGAVIPRVRMKELQGMPGTVGGLILHLCQFSFAVIGFAVMAATSDFPSVITFRSFGGACFNCERSGHRASECPTKQGYGCRT